LTTFRTSASDASYHSRHSRRTLRRAERIASNIDSPGSLLDVGCNNGITSQYLLDAGKASKIVGVELLESTVDRRLLDNPDFDLIEGNIVDVELQRRFDHVVYGAVHHHILNFHGLTAAIETLQKLVSHCDQNLFFETGQIAEGGRWQWQRAIRRYFRTDEEHFFYLLRSVEHLIDGFEIIGTFWIHGIRRSFIRLDTRRNQSDASESVDRMNWPTSADGPFARSFGSRNQSLYRDEGAEGGDSPTHFWLAKTNSGDDVFIKEHKHHPYSGDVEWVLGRQVEEHWAVRPVARTDPRDALVFPYLEGAVSISSFSAAPEAQRRKMAAAVLDIFADAADKRLSLPKTILLNTMPEARLIDVVDFNSNNFMVAQEDGHDVVRVVDFEQQSEDYAWRNHMHLARILWSLRQHRLMAVVYYSRGLAAAVWKLIKYQWQPLGVRISARQPALASLLVAEVRSVSGRLLGRLLAMTGIE
jgi:SAM-dependent methyltransferase